MATKKYKCKVCGYIHEGKTAPESCPVCKAPASEFDEIKEKRSFNKENGSYIFFHISKNRFSAYFCAKKSSSCFCFSVKIS